MMLKTDANLRANDCVPNQNRLSLKKFIRYVRMWI